MSYPRRLIPLITLLSLAAAGCQFLPQAGNKEAQTPSNSSAPAVSPNKLPPEQTYDLQVNKGEVWGLLKKVAFTDNTIIVELQVTNGSKQVIELNAKDDMFIRDNANYPYSGNRYNLSPPTDNRTLRVEPGNTVKGQFVFIGRLAPNATELSLFTNADNEYDRNSHAPRLRFEKMFIRR
ncbi:hypothetical protein [[Phormidium] sp. ETS-05]|uniref:hypothetical protein n=1 Tax=[Phormidium] sp. ETS-05 TaxID=222819 RepID=UPI0018EF079C|nr:hypothetical protein [[Phormidium] sp. ETS-05]